MTAAQLRHLCRWLNSNDSIDRMEYLKRIYLNYQPGTNYAAEFLNSVIIYYNAHNGSQYIDYNKMYFAEQTSLGKKIAAKYGIKDHFR